MVLETKKYPYCIFVYGLFFLNNLFNLILNLSSFMFLCKSDTLIKSPTDTKGMFAFEGQMSGQ